MQKKKKNVLIREFSDYSGYLSQVLLTYNRSTNHDNRKLIWADKTWNICFFFLNKKKSTIP